MGDDLQPLSTDGDPSPARMRVVCTAGHVDHGKSTLVAALTGTDPDRWAEEKRRGLTIDLGFAWTQVEGVGSVSFVDVPGHERFVPNMLAGAGPIGVAMFVVAADEGWMPQSAEHLQILRLLDLRHAVVALTRCDLVDQETAEISGELVAEELIGSSLEGAEIVRVSARTGAGLRELRAALARVLTQAEPAPDRDRPRLWIDRSFSVRGSGTVVTGTLVDGTVRTGDRLVVWPGQTAVRIRGMQVLERQVHAVAPGCRVALNLVGVDVVDVPRGTMLGRSEDWVQTTALDAWCVPSPGAVVHRRGAWKLHVGTAAVPVRLFPLAGTDLDRPGGVRLELESPLSLAAGDRFVLRDAGPGGTAGGGRVLDSFPPPRPRGSAHRQTAVAQVQMMAAADGPRDRLVALVTVREEVLTGHALARAGAGPADLQSAEDAGLVQAGDWLIAPDRWKLLSGLAVQAVLGTHQRRPALAAVDPAVPRTLLSTTGVDPAAVQAVLDHAVDTGMLEQIPGGLRAPGHEPRLTVAQQAARTALLGVLQQGGIETDPIRELAERFEADGDLLDALVREGQIVMLDGNSRAVTRAAFDQAAQALAALPGPFTASQAREALRTSRKYLLPLLEAMDAAGLTRRQGDHRTLI